MATYPIGTECCNNCVHWQPYRDRRIEGNPPEKVVTITNQADCPYAKRRTLYDDCCPMFAHIGGVTKTHPLPPKGSSPSDVYCEALLAEYQATADQARREREISAQHRLETADRNREILIDHGMDPNASESDQVAFEAIYRGMADGETEAYYAMGEACYFGKMGAVCDKERACRCYLTAAKKEYPQAEYSIGYCYYHGDGVSEDVERAKAWLKRATEHGSQSADKLLKKILDAEKVKKARAAVERMEAERREHVADHVDNCGMDPDASEMAKSLFMAAIGMGKDDVATQRDLGEWFAKGINGAIKDLSRSFDWYLKAAENGDAESEYRVGYAYYFGEGVKENNDRAFEWFGKAARQGHAAAQCLFAEFYLLGNGGDKDLEKAREWYAKSAEQGNGLAQFNLGKIYYFGKGIEKDYVKAVAWFTKASKDGRADAKVFLGTCYRCGLGVEKNFDKAFALYSKAAKEKCEAKFQLGRMYYWGEGVEVDYAKAVEWFKKAATESWSAAQLYLGTCYRRGRGVEKDLSKAFELYKKAAKDQREAKYWVGVFYDKGWGGVEKNAKEAFKWFLEAAELGDVDACCSIGWAYQLGSGVEQDFAKAVEWFGKGAEKDDGVCANNLARLYEDGKGVERDLGKALELFEKASEKKCNRAFYHLGRFYENGLGVEADLTKAKECYAKAAKSGDDDAKAALARIGA